MDIVLASASPRRRELLSMLGVENFRVIPALGEEIAEPGLSPDALVCALSLAKAQEVAAQCPETSLVIAADTVVALDGQIMGKPADKQDAFRMLSSLSGRAHTVYTGVTVLLGGRVLTAAEQTCVRFREMSAREIRAYIDTGEPMDKAGAYGAQGLGALFVEGIEGDFFNVMGLPLCRLSKMLEKLGVNLI